MSDSQIASGRLVLPLPRFVLHPLTTMVIAAVHLYLASGHVTGLVAGDVTWTNLWKGLGALGGAYVFAALASRALATRGAKRHLAASEDVAT
jgi:hypothetical protein